MKQVAVRGGRTLFLERKREQDRKREREKEMKNERLREMMREWVKRKGANKEYKAQSKTIPHYPFPRGNPELQSLNKGRGGWMW